MSKSADNVAFIAEAIERGAIVLNAETSELEVRTEAVAGLTLPHKADFPEQNVYLYNEATVLGSNTEGAEEMEHTRKQLKMISEIAQRLVKEGHFDKHKTLEVVIEGENSLKGARLTLTKEHIADGTDDLEVVVKDATVIERTSMKEADDPDELDMSGEGEIKVIIQAPNPEAVQVEVEASGEAVAAEEDAELDLELELEGDDEVLDEGTKRKLAAKKRQLATARRRKRLKTSVSAKLAERKNPSSRRDRSNLTAVQRATYGKQRKTRQAIAERKTAAEAGKNELFDSWARILK